MDTCNMNINNKDFILIKDYKDVEKYRKSLNQLVKKTFDFDFENWYQQGFWSDKYRPYSLLYKDAIVANISVNTIDFIMDGELKHAIQIGTVMTKETFRHQGLSRALMEIVLEEYGTESDFIYLYANDSVLDFYPRFGFVEAEEYIYRGLYSPGMHKLDFRKLDIEIDEDKAILRRLVTNTIPVSKYQMINNPELIFFHLTTFMSDHIYYNEILDLVAVIEGDHEEILVLDVYSEKEFDLEEILSFIVKKNETMVNLGFTPMQPQLFHCEKLKEEGTTFFVRGRCPLEKGKFPVLSHA